MKRRQLVRPLAVAFGLVVVLSACSGSVEIEGSQEGTAEAEAVATSNETSNETSSETSEAPAPEPDSIAVTELPDYAQLVVGDLSSVLVDSVPVWEGFDATDYPAVVILADENDEASGAVTVNHPDPGAVGSAVKVDDVAGLDDLYFIAEVEATIGQPENGLFDFDVPIGETPTYLLWTRQAEGQASPELRELAPAGSEAWPGLFLHEMFHLYQIASWQEAFVDQSFYDYEAENFELSLLEDAALVAAIDSDGPESQAAVRHFVALRSVRLDRFESTALDESQEASEGTAHWFEKRSRQAQTPIYVEPVVNEDLRDPTSFAYVHPFSRFYYSGGALMELLDRADIDWRGPIEAGESPSKLVREASDVDPSEYEELIAEARAAYDPDGAFTALAETFADGPPAGAGPAGAEPDDAADGDGEELEGGETIELDAELLDCLADLGIEETDLIEGDALPQEAVDACF